MATDSNVHFVSNVDGSHIQDTLGKLNPGNHVVSGGFQDLYHPGNHDQCQPGAPLVAGVCVDRRVVARHFVALSTNREAVQAFGIDPDNMFEFWDWVGGRYSLWSAIGLSIATLCRHGTFRRVAGRCARHGHAFPFRASGPKYAGHRGPAGCLVPQFFRAGTHAILPYDQHLHRLPAYLQQADMESNGKRVTRCGEVADYDTGPVIWGEPGTNGQHAFFQLIHQGTALIPCDFLMAVKPTTRSRISSISCSRIVLPRPRR